MPLSVDVPGVVEGWSQLLQRFGTIPLAKALQPAIRYARDGFPVQEIMADDWNDSAKRLPQDPAAAADVSPQRTSPKNRRDLRRIPDSRKTLELIASGGRDAFYKGPIARAIVADMRARNGLLDERDFADHTADWVETISTSYRGYDVHEMPPSTQGFVALEMLNILEGFDIKAMGHNSADYLHLVTEAKKIAFADRAAYLADRDDDAEGRSENAPVEGLRGAAPERDRPAKDRQLTSRHRSVAPTRPSSISRRRSRRHDLPDRRRRSGQRDLADSVALRQLRRRHRRRRNRHRAAQPRLRLHRCTRVIPTRSAPHKRPLHTLVPAMILKDGKPWVSFGVMGGDNQAQAHAQVVMNLVDFGMNIQDAGEAARMRHGGGELSLESGIGAEVREALEARGHKTRDGRGAMGGFQGILIDPRSGVLMGGSDPRKDGLAIGW